MDLRPPRPWKSPLKDGHRKPDMEIRQGALTPNRNPMTMNVTKSVTGVFGCRGGNSVSRTSEALSQFKSFLFFFFFLLFPYSGSPCSQ